MSKQSWYSMKALKGGKTAEVAIYSDIGAWGVTAGDFNRDLQSLGDVDTLKVFISSDGGDVSHGIAIFNILAAHKATKVVTVMGLAASMASVIAMAGDKVRMPSNAMMMIHEPWGGLLGRADELATFSTALKKMGAILRDTYANRTGLPKSEIADMMDAETWLDAEDAVAFGFADEVIDPVQIAASARFDISKFHNAPKANGQLWSPTMVTKAQAKKADTEANEDEEGEEEGPDAAAIRAQLVAEQNEIRSLCMIAGKPGEAEAFIKANKNPDEVREALAKSAQDAADAAAKAKGKNGRPKADNEVSAHNHATDNGGEAKEIDSADIFARWNKKGKYAA